MITGVPFNRILVDYLSLATSPANPLFFLVSGHSGETKHSGLSFYNDEAEACLRQHEETRRIQGEKLFAIGHETFLRAWNAARKKTGIYLKPKDLRDFFSQEMGKAFVPDRYIDIFQGRAPRGVLAKHYNPQGIRMLREIYDKANLNVLADA